MQVLKFEVSVQKLGCMQLEKGERYNVSIIVFDLFKDTHISICISSQKYAETAIKNNSSKFKIVMSEHD